MMTTSQAQAESHPDARPPSKPTPLDSYVSAHAAHIAKSVHAELGGRPAPFRRWSWRPIPAPGKKLGELRWMCRVYFLCRFLNAGGILVVVGRRSFERARLLQQFPLRIVDHSRVGAVKNAPVTRADLALGPLIIDETAAHDRDDVLRVINYETAAKRGLVLVFPDAETFRDYEIGSYIADQRVRFLELDGG